MLLKLQKPGLRLAINVAIAFFVLGNIYPNGTTVFYASFDKGIFNQYFGITSTDTAFKVSSSSLSTNVVQVVKFRSVYHRLGQHFTPA